MALECDRLCNCTLVFVINRHIEANKTYKPGQALMLVAFILESLCSNILNEFL
jgi:hypothetical protein